MISPSAEGASPRHFTMLNSADTIFRCVQEKVGKRPLRSSRPWRSCCRPATTSRSSSASSARAATTASSSCACSSTSSGRSPPSSGSSRPTMRPSSGRPRSSRPTCASTSPLRSRSRSTSIVGSALPKSTNAKPKTTKANWTNSPSEFRSRASETCRSCPRRTGRALSPNTSANSRKCSE
jgi:hypothetical protein